MKKLYGVVILYNPEKQIIENIKTYLPYLERLYVMDNSEKVNENYVKLIKQISEKICYICLGKNYGISYPINRVINRLPGDSWLLTMDQDSSFYRKSFKNYIEIIDKLDNNVYGISPQIIYKDKFIKLKCNGSLKLLDKCIQSGAIFNVEILKKVGNFDENLFIDGVDTEICYRCNKMGYKLYRNNKGILLHHLGNEINNVRSKLLPFKVTQHNRIRRYYIVRNNLYLKDKYPNKKIKIFLYLIVGIIKIILLDDNRISKLKAAWKGYIDYKNNIFGRRVDI